MTAEQIKELIREEISNNLRFEVSNHGFESTGLVVKVEYDGEVLCYEHL